MSGVLWIVCYVRRSKVMPVGASPMVIQREQLQAQDFSGRSLSGGIKLKSAIHFQVNLWIV